MSGFAGLATGLALATEFEGDGTPHAHGFVSLANMYQHHSLASIGDIISSNQHGLGPDAVVESITNCVEDLQRENHLDNDQHQITSRHWRKNSMTTISDHEEIYILVFVPVTFTNGERMMRTYGAVARSESGQRTL